MTTRSGPTLTILIVLNVREQHESFQSGVSSELWAIVSAAAWAADSTLVRKGTAFSNPSTAALISFSVNAAVLVLYIIYQYPAEKIFQSANLFFVLSGIIQPTIVRVTFYVGIVRLGVSRAGPIRRPSPFFSVAIAFFLFRERPELIVYLGGLLTIAGTWVVSYRRVGEAQWRAIDPAWLPAVLWKRQSIKIDRQSLPFYGGAAVFALIGQLCTFIALNGGQISVVAPLINTTPLFAIACCSCGEEKITPMVLIGVVLLVAGIGFITAR